MPCILVGDLVGMAEMYGGHVVWAGPELHIQFPALRPGEVILVSLGVVFFSCYL